ncbi:prefoldin subunit 1 [Trichodelitschia bisporula]|uniref:Prefoldin subunit 1 n=1 Tax=Trichodelitschia bisporula TaxID=703511 RepID=A0A6G1HYP8_9PEZI|nr:prefoldin subunit 1 [Trichodelitschia bisporula]
MSISNEALRKVLLEIEQKSAFSSQQLGIVKTQLAAKHRESRMLQLTANEVGVLPQGTQLYEGVGKMFIQTPSGEVVDRLAREKQALTDDVANLEKKRQYLETTFKNSREHMDRILRSAGPM